MSFLSLDIWDIWNGPLVGGWVVGHLDFSVSYGPLLSFEFWHLRLRLEMDQDPSLTILYFFCRNWTKTLNVPHLASIWVQSWSLKCILCQFNKSLLFVLIWWSPCIMKWTEMFCGSCLWNMIFFVWTMIFLFTACCFACRISVSEIEWIFTYPL